MATGIGRWSLKRVNLMKEHIIGFLLERNKWLNHYDDEFLTQFKSTELVQIQFWEALSFSTIIGNVAMKENKKYTNFKFLAFLKRNYEGGLTTPGIYARLFNLKKPYFQLSNRQIFPFIRTYIPNVDVEEDRNGKKLISLLEFTINGYRKKLRTKLPLEWRSITQGNPM